MYLGYNTNGFAHHRLEDAIEILAGHGYEGVALTLDFHALNPFDPEFARQQNDVRALLKRHRLRCVIETGARYILDSRRKHQPTLLSREPELRRYRLEFLERAIYLAANLEADAVSLWSGNAPGDHPDEVLMGRLVDGCKALCDTASRYGVRLAFEPEPGMFIDTMHRFGHLHSLVDRTEFGLTLDVGHAHCVGDPVSEAIEQWKDVLWNVHIEDMRRGVHEHLMFGDGEMNFREILSSLAGIDYRGGVFVELSRHSGDAVETARKSLSFLRGVER